MRIKSKFAILDVERGIGPLQMALENNGGVEVVIRGRITGVWGGHDGVSQEFNVDVSKVEVVDGNGG